MLVDFFCLADTLAVSHLSVFWSYLRRVCRAEGVVERRLENLVATPLAQGLALASE